MNTALHVRCELKSFTDDPDTPDLLIYGELRDASPTSVPTVASTSASPPKVLHLLAARILPGPPPPPSFRLPRPDDPTPRRPPQTFGAKRKRDTSGVPFDLSGSTTSAEGSKRAKTVSDAKGKGRASAHDEALRKAAAETMLRIPKPQRSVAQQVDVKALGKDARVGLRKEKDKEKDRDVFKVPSVPARATLARTASETDVFGSLRGGPLEGVVGDAAVEKENKTVRRRRFFPRDVITLTNGVVHQAVKRIVARRLEQEGIGKTHGEFQEVYQMCYRGASFALVSLSEAWDYEVGILIGCCSDAGWLLVHSTCLLSST